MLESIVVHDKTEDSIAIQKKETGGDVAGITSEQQNRMPDTTSGDAE